MQITQFTESYLRSLSLLEQVALTNNTFGKCPLDPKDPDFWTKIQSQFLLVKEEHQEMINAKTDIDRRDGVCDVLVTAYGLLHLAGQTNESLKEFGDKSVSYSNEEVCLKDIDISMVIVEDSVIYRYKDFVIFTCYLTQEVIDYAQLLNMNVKEDMYQVLVSNLSKVCKTKGDAIITQTYYRETLGLNTQIEECGTIGGYIVKVKGEQTGLDGNLYPDGKFAKCRVGFQKPKFN